MTPARATGSHQGGQALATAPGPRGRNRERPDRARGLARCPAPQPRGGGRARPPISGAAPLPGPGLSPPRHPRYSVPQPRGCCGALSRISSLGARTRILMPEATPVPGAATPGLLRCTVQDSNTGTAPLPGPGPPCPWQPRCPVADLHSRGPVPDLHLRGSSRAQSRTSTPGAAPMPQTRCCSGALTKSPSPGAAPMPGPPAHQAAPVPGPRAWAVPSAVHRSGGVGLGASGPTSPRASSSAGSGPSAATGDAESGQTPAASWGRGSTGARPVLAAAKTPGGAGRSGPGQAGADVGRAAAAREVPRPGMAPRRHRPRSGDSPGPDARTSALFLLRGSIFTRP